MIKTFTTIKNSIAKLTATFLMVAIAIMPIWLSNMQSAAAYPFWAQQTAPETPREATGRIVCANCHLGKKFTEVELPQAVLPDTVFKAVVKIPYDMTAQQLLSDGSKGGLNVGAVLMLPEGFKIAPPERLSEEMKEETAGLYFQPYKEGQENVVIVGPIPGEQYQEIVFPVLSPNPDTDKSIHYGKYQVHVGGNRGRGQLYPAGNKTNNAIYNASASGTIANIAYDESGGNQITIQTEDGKTVVDTVPPGPILSVAQGDVVEVGQALNIDPSVGGFGQDDGEIVLQSAGRIQGLIALFVLIMLTQIMLVLKKKQIEKVQAVELNF